MILTPSASSRRRRAAMHAFTMVELMVTIFVFSFVIAGLVYTEIFAMRVYTLSATKLNAATGAREALNSMRDEIRSAKIVLVGTYIPGVNGSFVQATNNTPQLGNALALSFTNNSSTNYLVYYLDNTQPTNFLFKETNGVTWLLASYVTNYYVFDAEDYSGHILSNYLNNPVIHVTMDFSQWEYPIAFVGSNGINAYDYYTLQARITRRAK
jgi:type II secretory pathway pseudopilin PulG